MTNRPIERRFLALDSLELRAADGKPPELVGYASVFNQPVTISGWWDEWQEEVSPGAFAKTILEADIRALFNHDAGVVLGRNKAGTLELREDDHGLHTVIRPPDNEWGRPVLEAVKRGDITGMSIAFQAIKQEWFRPEKGSKELPKRTVKEAKLFDVSVVTYPAFPQTSVSARALEPDGEEDPLQTALRLVACARAGMPLDTADRDILSAAVEHIRSVMPTAEPGQGAHSDARPGEPGGVEPRHSPQERRRVLELLQLEGWQ